MRAVFAHELATGLVIGALLGAAFFAFAFAIWGEADIAAGVGVSLAISCSIASVVAMALRTGWRAWDEILRSDPDRLPRHPGPALDRRLLCSRLLFVS